MLALGLGLLFSNNIVRASGKGTWVWKGRRWRSVIKVNMKSAKDKYLMFATMMTRTITPSLSRDKETAALEVSGGEGLKLLQYKQWLMGHGSVKQERG